SRTTRIEPRVKPKRTEVRATQTPAPPPVPAPAPAPDLTASAEACSCRVRGNIEVDAGRPLPERMRVTVWLEGLPDRSDVVEMFMGSPRPFDLGWVPCGTRRVEFSTSSKQRWQVRFPEPVRCRANGLVHVPVMLEPAKRGSR